MDFAAASDGGDEGRPELAAEALHFREGQFEGVGHLLAGHIPRSKNKFAHGMFFEGAFFEEVVTDALVRSEQDPTLGTEHREPCFIQRCLRKVGQVTLETDSVLGESALDCARIAKVLVEIENKLLRRRRGARVPSEWPLRSAVARSHTPRPNRRRTPGR